jgi:hypothetical protein
VEFFYGTFLCGKTLRVFSCAAQKRQSSLRVKCHKKAELSEDRRTSVRGEEKRRFVNLWK